LDRLGGRVAATTRGIEKKRTNKVFIDFSDTINENDCRTITKLLKEWWGIPVFPEDYKLTDVWAETWILILEGSDWDVSVQQRNEYTKSEGIVVSALESKVLRGFHIGAGYPEEISITVDRKSCYRNFCFVDWGGCVSEANDVELKKYKRYDEDTWDEKREGAKLGEEKNLNFLEDDALLEELKNPNTDVWDNAAVKIAAWWACHELCHAAFPSRGNDLRSFPFRKNIPTLLILLMYTEAGRKVHPSYGNFDFGTFYGFFGKEGLPERKK